MKKVLFLYGMCCAPSVWDALKDRLEGIAPVFAEYPREIIQAANTVSDLTRWAMETYGGQGFDAVAGHSLGGLIALEMSAKYAAALGTVIMIESNLRPANPFYRNLMMPQNMVKFGDGVLSMLRCEAPYYTDALKQSVQEDFDFTPYVHRSQARLFALYGNRGLKNYSRRVSDLCLDPETEAKLHFKFIRNACHMPMIENPQGLADTIIKCLP